MESVYVNLYSKLDILVHLKGHGNEPVFPMFLHKSVRHESLTVPFEPFRFWLQIRGNGNSRQSCRLPHSPMRGVGFDYEYLREFEAKIGTDRLVVKGTHAKPVYAKTSEKPVHCHVPLTRFT